MILIIIKKMVLIMLLIQGMTLYMKMGKIMGMSEREEEREDLSA